MYLHLHTTKKDVNSFQPSNSTIINNRSTFQLDHCMQVILLLKHLFFVNAYSYGYYVVYELLTKINKLGVTTLCNYYTNTLQHVPFGGHMYLQVIIVLVPFPWKLHLHCSLCAVFFLLCAFLKVSFAVFIIAMQFKGSLNKMAFLLIDDLDTRET